MSISILPVPYANSKAEKDIPVVKTWAMKIHSKRYKFLRRREASCMRKIRFFRFSYLAGVCKYPRFSSRPVILNMERERGGTYVRRHNSPISLPPQPQKITAGNKRKPLKERQPKGGAVFRQETVCLFINPSWPLLLFLCICLIALVAGHRTHRI